SNDNTLRINGMPSSSQAIRIDGQDATNGLWRQQNQAVQPSVDAMQEVAVQTGNFDAEYGEAGGGYFNYTMKSGTNNVHGAIYDPRTTRTAPDGSTVRDAFQNNIIPQNLMDPVALKIQAMLPLPTNSQLVNNYVIPGYSNFRHITIPSFKIDHNFNARNRIN